MAELEEVLDEKTKERIMFTNNEWKLNLDVSTTNVNGATNIVLEHFWTRPDKDEIYPLKKLSISPDKLNGDDIGTLFSLSTLQ